MCIAAGVHRHPLRRIEEGADCTWFVPSARQPAAARKQWIAGTLRPAGAITIDAGALRALLEGRSLLPAGVTAARGRFDRGDTVSVLAADGAEIAPRHRRLLRRGCRPHHGTQVLGDRRYPGGFAAATR